MSVRTLLAYLFGNRKAVMRIAQTPAAIWLGVLFVLSAGFAREYDGEDLTREPWHVLVPLGASIVTSFLLYCMATGYSQMSAWRHRPSWFDYRSFLSLYWMTAPLAWLYAIPFERMVSAPDAVRFNLLLLAIVSLWRVLLMTRVINVIYGFGLIASFFVVMLFADTIAMVVLYFTPLPVLNIMGGIRMSESEQIIRNTATLVAFLGVVSWPVWFFGSFLAVGLGRSDPNEACLQVEQDGKVSRSLWCLGVASLAIWGFILPFAQPQQRLRHSVEQAMKNNRIDEAVQIMSQHQPEDFPPHWDPPPRLAYRDPHPRLLTVLESISRGHAAVWVEQVYFEKLNSILDDHYGSARYLLYDDENKPDGKYLNLLGETEAGLALVREHTAKFENLEKSEREQGRAQTAAIVRQLLEKAGADNR